MKLGRFEQQGRVFFGAVEGGEVSELEGSILGNYRSTAKPQGLYSRQNFTVCPCRAR